MVENAFIFNNKAQRQQSSAAWIISWHTSVAFVILI
jgi:hypothetical protein